MRFFVVFKEKTAYVMRISDWSSDVCSSDLMAEDLKNTGKGNLFVVFGEPDIEILDAGPDGEQGQIRVKVNGVDVFHPNTGEVRSDGAEGIACWFIDTDYKIGRASWRERV